MRTVMAIVGGLFMGMAMISGVALVAGQAELLPHPPADHGLALLQAYLPDVRIHRSAYETSAAADGSAGIRVAFIHWQNGVGTLYAQMVSGSKLALLESHPDYDVAGVWSADGTQMQFVAHREGRAAHYVADIERGLVHPLEGWMAF